MDSSDIQGDCPGRDIEFLDGQCQLPSEFHFAFKMTVYNVGEDGHPGSGLDLDDDRATCAPMQYYETPQCSHGVDNAFVLLGLMANYSLDQAVGEGTMNVIFSLQGYDNPACPFTMDFFRGALLSGNPGCVNEEGCEYAITEDSFDPATCTPLSSIGNARVTDGNLTGGRDGDFIYSFDVIIVGVRIVVPVYFPRIEAQVQFEGGIPAVVDGIIGGVIMKDDFIGAFEAVPADEYPEGVTKAEMIDMLQSLYAEEQFERDYDLDSDTEPESSSIGIIFSALPVSIDGII